ncbi:GNAT family N-acetyltransferase [Fulvivirgaceae bacterium BMA12]|uniref:GNAT family N-acetyltransferase n=1 Tax=Agaribacillus aureus TaxID=3051825 RepID=A0ABT8L4K6_9BACT|nr:GNAT family N-acetyltransferase [Fulvivirgaceae bacterium BMA12]
MTIHLREDKILDPTQVINLYKANKWSSGEKPRQLMSALANSHAVVTAWDEDILVGLGNSLSDGSLVVYYPHLLVHPQYHGLGIGRMIMEKFQEKYGGFHQQILVANNQAVKFYRKCGFKRAYKTSSMWIFRGNE